MMKVLRPVLVVVLIGLLVALVVYRLEAAGKLGALNEAQVQDLRHEYPLLQADCPDEAAVVASDFETIIETSNTFVLAEVTQYSQGNLSVIIREMEYLGDGAVSFDPSLAFIIGESISIRVPSETHAGCAIDDPGFLPGAWYVFPLDIRPENAPIGSDDYTLRPGGLFHVVDGTHVLSVYSLSEDTSMYDGYKLNRFMKAVYRIRGDRRDFNDGRSKWDIG